MFPQRREAEALLKEAEECNPGHWADHSRVAAHCAEKIAENCGMDPQKAYVLGLLHDIGRKYCRRYIGHIYDGYAYMMRLGYDEAARICLTHSFQTHKIEDYVGQHDVSPQELEQLCTLLENTQYDDYDLLIQLCDTLAGNRGVMYIEDRMNNVRRRYGSYPQDKWNACIQLKEYFEQRMGKDLYAVTGRPESSK